VKICLFAFDLLYLNGHPLLKETLERRRQLLHENFGEIEGSFQFAKHINETTTEEIQAFLEEAIQSRPHLMSNIADSCEGLMVKTLREESSYEPSRRSRNWLKIKKDYLQSTGDSLDLVVIGGYSGRGKRTGVYGGYLLACYDQASEEFQAICKIGTGFSEADLEAFAGSLREHIIVGPKPYYRVKEGVKPDVWFSPIRVWEVKAADFSLSPIYSAGHGMVDGGEKGISLRFPRFIRVREDKRPEDATSAEQIAELYRMQRQSSREEHQEIDEYY
jgi:DNA ligase 1